MRRLSIAIFILSIVFSISVVAVIGQQDYGWQDATEEAYFYALFNTDALIQSGFGVQLEDQQELVASMIAESGYTSENEPEITPLLLPFSSGRPEYAQSASYEWVGDPRDELIRTRDLAQMIIAYAAQAKQLERLYQTGIDQDGETRLGALLRGLVASEALAYAHSNMLNPVDDLYLRTSTDTTPGYEAMDQAMMLWALSELTMLTDGYSFYRGPVSRFESELWADDLLEAIRAHLQKNPTWLRLDLGDNALFIQALATYGSVTSSAAHLERTVDLIHTQATTLTDQLDGDNVSTAMRARAIRALVNALWMTGDESFRTEALRQWDILQRQWNAQLGLFDLSPFGSGADPNYEYSAMDVGDIVSAFSALIYGAGLDELKEPFAQFFQSLLKNSRMMYAELDSAGGGFDNDIVPSPMEAGGPFGTAPVFAAKVLFDLASNGGEWYVTNTNFETLPAMYLSTQLTWIGQRERQSYVGPPRYGIPMSREAQFIGLQKQIDQLRSTQASEEDVDGIRTLLQNTESTLRNINNRMDSINAETQNLPLLESQISQLSSEISDLRSEIDTLESSIAQLEANQQALSQQSDGTPRGPITMDETVTILVVFLLVLIGFVTFQWVIRRGRAKSEE